MPSFSQVNVLGYVGNPVQLMTGKGKNFVQLSVGVTKAYRQGKKWNTKTSWFKVMFFGEYADIVATRVKKGDWLHITGELAVSEWVKDGINRYDLYVAGRHFTPMRNDKGSKDDDNYGVPEDEIADDQMVF